MRLIATEGKSSLMEAFLNALDKEVEVRIVTQKELLDIDSLKAALKGGDVLMHLAPTAAISGDEFYALDLASRGTFNLMSAAIEAGIDKIVLGSSLSLFDRVPTNWKVDEQWKPRPDVALDNLIPHIAELSVCEATRVTPARVACLRFGAIVSDADIKGLPFDPNWLHIEDAVQALICALRFVQTSENLPRWHVFHISAKGTNSKIRVASARQSHMGYEPMHDFASNQLPSEANISKRDTRSWREVLAPADPIPSRPIKKVVLFGAGGPVASDLITLLSKDYALRITDARSIPEIIAENKPQSPGAPLPALMGAPHEYGIVDVRNAREVEDACEGMDAIINLSVLRHDPVLAFHVNTIGAYHIAKAAVKHRIRRVVQTGPQLLTLSSMSGYHGHYEIPGDAPMRPGCNLYGHSKFLGQEIMRVFAENYGLEVPVLLYSQFLNPEVDKWVHAMAVTWKDSARALKLALEVESLPSPYEVMHILADIPHAQFSPRRAWDLIGWKSEENLQHLWDRQQES